MTGSSKRIGIIGGGAAGFFGAIACAEALRLKGADHLHKIVIQEATLHPLAKVRVSGGGRCNLTNACTDPRELAKRYPRGSRELIGPLSRFGPTDTRRWFEDRGVATKAEPDGRVFPVSDNSASVVDCLQACAEREGIALSLGRGVRGITAGPGGGFELSLQGGATLICDRVLLASGGGAAGGGMALAQALGHTLIDPLPSLFTFNITDPRLEGLSGLAARNARVSIPGTRLSEEGPVLITHWGLSGPAILRCSAWGARDLAKSEHRFTLHVNWAPECNKEKALAELNRFRQEHARKRPVSACPFPSVPLRLWERLLLSAGVPADINWSSMPKESMHQLAELVTASRFEVQGKSTNKEEFVTCGGVKLSEVDFKTMESKKVPGLYFAGEVLDIDGITGGFNFQAAWTTGHQAGLSIAESLLV